MNHWLARWDVEREKAVGRPSRPRFYSGGWASINGVRHLRTSEYCIMALRLCRCTRIVAKGQFRETGDSCKAKYKYWIDKVNGLCFARNGHSGGTDINRGWVGYLWLTQSVEEGEEQDLGRLTMDWSREFTGRLDNRLVEDVVRQNRASQAAERQGSRCA